MMSLMEKQQRALLKKFHTLCSKAGISQEEKRAMVESYGHASSRELSAHELMDLCDKMDRSMRPDLAELDKWRKRLIASIFAWRKAMMKPANMNQVKAIACRAARVDRFNSIPMERLRSLYSAFVNKAKDIEMVDDLTAEDMDYTTWVN